MRQVRGMIPNEPPKSKQVSSRGTARQLRQQLERVLLMRAGIPKTELSRPTQHTSGKGMGFVRFYLHILCSAAAAEGQPTRKALKGLRKERNF